MPLASTLDTNVRFSAIFVGESGSGKTPAACSFMEKEGSKRVLNYDFDLRIRGLLGTPWVDKSRVEYIPFPPIMTGKQVFVEFDSKLRLLQQQIATGNCPYDTVVLDSITGFCNSLICDAIPLVASKEKGGKKIGAINFAGMQEYGYEATGTDSVLSFLRSLPIKNFIVTAHLVDKFGKIDPDKPFSPTEVIGEQIMLRNKIAARLPIYFDHIFVMKTKMINGTKRFFVEFRGELARTTFSKLPDSVEITGKNFYEWMTKEAGIQIGDK